MDAEPIGHLVLIEVQLFARDQQFFAKTKFRHNYLASDR